MGISVTALQVNPEETKLWIGQPDSLPLAEWLAVALKGTYYTTRCEMFENLQLLTSQVGVSTCDMWRIDEQRLLQSTG